MIRRERDEELAQARPREACLFDEEELPERLRGRMIRLTRLDGSRIYVNAELIEFLEETPDTVVSLTTGRKLVVKEPAAEVSEQIVAIERRIHGAERQATTVTG
jgi:flagellar protein FlbD